MVLHGGTTAGASCASSGRRPPPPAQRHPCGAQALRPPLPLPLAPCRRSCTSARCRCTSSRGASRTRRPRAPLPSPPPKPPSWGVSWSFFSGAAYAALGCYRSYASGMVVGGSGGSRGGRKGPPPHATSMASCGGCSCRPGCCLPLYDPSSWAPSQTHTYPHHTRLPHAPRPQPTLTPHAPRTPTPHPPPPTPPARSAAGRGRCRRRAPAGRPDLRDPGPLAAGAQRAGLQPGLAQLGGRPAGGCGAAPGPAPQAVALLLEKQSRKEREGREGPSALDGCMQPGPAAAAHARLPVPHKAGLKRPG